MSVKDKILTDSQADIPVYLLNKTSEDELSSRVDLNLYF